MTLNRLSLPLLIGALLLPTMAGAVQYDRVDTARSSIRFVPVLMGTKTEGNFKKFTAQIRFDPDLCCHSG